MSAARISRWAMVVVPAALVGSVLTAGAGGAQSPSAVPALSAPPALAAEVEAIIGQVEDLRGIDRTEEIVWQLGDRDTALAEQLERETSDPETLDRIGQDERIYTRLGLLPEGTDLLGLMVEALQGQVAGFFDPETESLTVLDEDGELDLVSRLTLAHEVDHAIQDQRWGLKAMQEAIPLTEGDRVAAFKALVEGDATLLMTLWAASHAASDLVGVEGSSLPGGDSLEDMPQVIQRELLFPYLDGLTFLMRAWGPGGWDAVNAIWDAPPVSAEQIMHPEKYPDERPIEVALPDVAAALGEGWTQTGESVLGELTTSVLLADGAEWDPMGFSLDGVRMPNWEAAAGWGGDRLVTVDGPDGVWALVWQSAWDTPQDAVEFQDGVTAALGDLAAASSVSPLDVTGAGLESPVVVVLASDEATKQLVEGAIGTLEPVPAG